MPKYRVEITKVAEKDILEIYQYIYRDSPMSAKKWAEEIERQINSLESFPKRCPVISETEEIGREYRHLIYGNYRTVFRIQSSKVIIMRVINSARLFDLHIFEE
ncbi:MAG: type II toxin-antitoxin system RelE/ParE family toxin [Elusimicrobiota bacterium]